MSCFQVYLCEVTMSHDLKEILGRVFGFDQFRPGQEEAIQALLSQRRVLCIQPTGHGKSLLYQLPSLVLDGITVVISPLLALMRDQIDHLTHRFNIPAGAINTDQSPEENSHIRVEALAGRLKILFLAPEQLDNLDSKEFLEQLPVTLLVVDEAHCISVWGHDFRPSYRQIIKTIQHFQQRNPNLHVLGLTATADRRTEADIAQQLRAPECPPLKVLRSSMDRHNLALQVISVKGHADKLERLRALMDRMEGCGILYCATREQTELVADYLSQHNHKVVSYHAGYDPERKRALQSSFIASDYKAIAATNALGMGIDKPDVRFIIHVDVPGSITAYYQEVGRAGRDGLPARGFLMFDPADSKIQRHFIHSAQPVTADFEKVFSILTPDNTGLWPNLQTIKVRSGLHPTRVTVIMAELVEQGFVEKVRMQNKQVYRRLDREGFPDLSRYENRYQVRTAELEAMLKYGHNNVGCLMANLRLALGDEHAEPCGRCSVCQPQTLQQEKVDGLAAADWLVHRNNPIAATKQPKMEEGLALFKSELQHPLFIDFMRHRMGGKGPQPVIELDPALISLLKPKVEELGKRYSIGLVAALPSRTWKQRESAAALVAGWLGAPARDHLITWSQVPEKRQGELLNNDQRKQNVVGTLACGDQAALEGVQDILLLDDYIGSGATFKEAVRVLRKKAGFKGGIVPLTIASVKWRLGSAGMI